MNELIHINRAGIAVTEGHLAYDHSHMTNLMGVAKPKSAESHMLLANSVFTSVRRCGFLRVLFNIANVATDK